MSDAITSLLADPARPATVDKPAAGQLAPLHVDAVEAARLCGVGRSLWLELHTRGEVPAGFKLGRRLLWSIRELELWDAAGRPAREQFNRILMMHRQRAIHGQGFGGTR